MRNRKPLDALFPKTRQRLLAAVLAGGRSDATLSELARHLGVPPSSLQRELSSLVEAGILRRSRQAGRVTYPADPACPILGELRAIVVKTVGVVDVVRQALARKKSRIAFAFVHGSVASGEARSGSDVDLIIVGKIGLAELASVLDTLQDRLGRPVNPMVYSPEEFARKAGANDHFLATVLRGKILMILGDPDDLAAASG